LIPNHPVFSANKWKVVSPNNKIEFEISKAKKVLEYSVIFQKKNIINHSLIQFNLGKEGVFSQNLDFGKAKTQLVHNRYHLMVGKNSEIDEDCNELWVPILDKSNHIEIDLRIRVFNDGIGFRYEFPKQSGKLEIREERTEFNFTGNPKVLTLFRPNFTTSHEGIYSRLNLNSIKNDTLMDLPTLFEWDSTIYAGVSEANLVDYAGMYLIKKDGILVSELSPLPDSSGLKVKGDYPFLSPWRVIWLGNRVGSLIESNILTNLNEPLKIIDTSWIKPGKTSFPWWNGNVTPDTDFAPGNNFETNKYYIDFCAKAGIEYHSVVEYGLHEWYVSDGVYFQPGPHTDASKPVPGLDIQKICDYAQEKGVGIRFWVHWKALYPILDKAFDQYQKWGIKGLMVDFMDRDDQEMVRIQHEILVKAAAHHLHIQFHGAYKPTGIQRTYPNEFTREGTLNYENNKGSNIVDPDQDINIPFTRMLAGPTDYHLGGFRAIARDKFKVQYTAPLMLGTRTHMMAMYIVLENPLGMVCDYPNAYIGQPGFEYIQKLPTVWDETKVPGAKVGEWVAIARRKGNKWFLGAISNWNSRNIILPLDFLGEGKFKAHIYLDAPDADSNPNHLIEKDLIIDESKSLQLKMEKGGGIAIEFTRI